LSTSGTERMVNGWEAASGKKRIDLSEETAWFGAILKYCNGHEGKHGGRAGENDGWRRMSFKKMGRFWVQTAFYI